MASQSVVIRRNWAGIGEYLFKKLGITLFSLCPENAPNVVVRTLCYWRFLFETTCQTKVPMRLIK